MDILLEGKKQFTLKNNMYFIMKCSPIFFWSFEFFTIVFIINTISVFNLKIFRFIPFIPIRIITSILLGIIIGNFPIMSFWGIHYVKQIVFGFDYRNRIMSPDVLLRFNQNEIQFTMKSSICYLSKETLFLKKYVHYKMTNRGVFFYISRKYYLFYVSKNQKGYMDFIQNLKKMKEGF